MSIIPWKNKSVERRGDDWLETPLARFRDEMDNLFERFFGERWGPSALEAWPARFGFGPRIELAETENDICLKVELPGVDPKDVDIRVEGNVLSLRGEKKQEKEEKKKDYHYVERQYGGFQRSVQLPSSVDANKIDASYKDGVLTVTIAKKPEAKAKKITVRTE
jgi:HSP20 family protein